MPKSNKSVASKIGEADGKPQAEEDAALTAAKHAALIATKYILDEVARHVHPRPHRRTITRWLLRARVRRVRPTNSRVGGASFLWHRGDVEKFIKRLTGGAPL
jgi:hypothetical protein